MTSAVVAKFTWVDPTGEGNSREFDITVNDLGLSFNRRRAAVDRLLAAILANA